MGKIRKISATGSEPVKTALTVQKTVGATSITVNSIEGWHTGTGSDDEVPFVIYAIKPTGEIIAGSQSSWMGVVSRSSSTINNLRLTGGQDQIYPVGSKVVATSTAAWANELAEALLVSHNPDGSLKTQDVPNNSIDGVKLKDGTVDGTKIKDGSIEPVKIKSGSIPFVETLPTKQTIPVGFGYSVTLTRFGKLVFVSSTGIANITSAGARSETIPVGWRPAQTAALIGIAINNTNFAGGFSLIFNANGGIQWHGARGHNEYHISAVYFLP